MRITMLLVAVPPDGAEGGANNFLESTLGKGIAAGCGAVAVIVGLICILTLVRHVSAGRAGEGFKKLLFGLTVCGLLFNLDFTVEGSKFMGAVAGAVFESVTSATGLGGDDNDEDGTD
ncbi:hypothetical protein [Actinomadura sp. SCN-SB]|uniref:hypothetical protein n=1 Tax=Actinomadura sp. SCN-SB TaxID=3373092 RepID=UPI0037539CAF